MWDYRQHVTDFSNCVEPNQKADIIPLGKIPNDSLLLDVRSVQEVHDEPIPSLSVQCQISNIPLDELANQLNHLDQNQSISCICKSGQRALNAAQLLIDRGFKNISVTSR